MDIVRMKPKKKKIEVRTWNKERRMQLLKSNWRNCTMLTVVAL